MPFTQRAISLQLHIAYLFIGLLLSFAVVSGIYHYREETRLLLDAADKEMSLVGDQTGLQMEGLYQPAATFVDLLAQQRLMRATTLDERLDSLPFVLDGMRRLPAVTASYIGYDNGDFFMLRRWRSDPAFGKLFHAPAGTRWVVQSLIRIGTSTQGEFLYLDDDGKLLSREWRDDYRFDPRSRGWYQAARKSPDQVTSPPYIFFTTRQSGITLSRRSGNDMAVAGADIQLDDIGRILQKSRLTPHSALALLDEQGAVLSWDLGVPEAKVGPNGQLRPPALSDTGNAVLIRLQQLNPEDRGEAFTVNGEDWQGTIEAVPVPGGKPLKLLIAAPHRELLADALAIRNRILLVTGLLIVIGVALASWLARLASRPLSDLTHEAEKIRRFDFADPVGTSSTIKEVVQLAQSFDSMKSTIRQFLDLSSTLASETHFPTLLKRVLTELQQATGAEGGLLLLIDADNGKLTSAERIWRGHAPAESTPLAINADSHPGHPLLSALQNPDRPLPLDADTARMHFGTLGDIDRPLTLLAMPLQDRSGQLLGAVALLVDEVRAPLGADRLGFAHALSGTAAIALQTQQLINEQKILLESFIQLIAGAIDAKSPYTGGHCQRVPDLTKRLAEAACQEKQGVFADFKLSAEEWEELHIAAWLHDCGKVTTPEYVVDKATKLETLYDRIHEVRMRFEVLKRDAETACWKAIAEGGEREALLENMAEEQKRLDDDFAFVASCNEGGEFMSPDRVARLKALAGKTWLRTLSDRLGVSFAEKKRKDAQGAETLPAPEALLADKPEHIIPREDHDRLPTDSRWQFRVDMPEHLYNRGELYNLSVGRGTLSEEERYKINEHIIQTIIMLGNLPLPRHLRRIPEIAGGHHEKMDGSGYPRRLKREEMGWTARMMAIADIFEALTAGDRPYKQGKTLSEAIRIMSFMKKDQHIDPDLFDLFLRTGIYLDYARQYMDPAQIDDVDIQPYLSPVGV
ncbi:HD domain-containing phosphohydrolase [uncultured Aquitalea sp.]|uniref:HD domain-containing phosphohydrolase n=1 Tax=uncultured Aquitalea sp. TaxID=540272 RepID=UPI002600FB23|nr:HD domain-containing phosphohydrolase [uncultured Aquitalea sp.]